MGQGQQHIVCKTVLQLSLPAGTDGFAQQQRWSEVINHQMAPALEEVFDRNSPPDSLHRIDRLEVDLGSVPQGWRNEQLAQAILQGVEKALAACFADHKNRVESRPIALAEMDVLVWFFKTGQLPAGATGLDLARVFRQTVDSHLGAFLLALRQPSHPQAGGPEGKPVQVARRMVLQLDERERVFFLQKMSLANTGEAWRWLPIFYTEHLLRGGARLRQMFWEDWLRLLLGEDLPAGPLAEVFYTEFYQKNRQQADGKFWKKVVKAAPATVQPFFNTDKKQLGNNIADATTNEQAPTSSTEKAGIFCQHTGLLLLHPFLKSFFQNLHLLAPDGRAFQSRDKQEQAVFWLYFLATGRDSAPEHELTFCKLLCGLPLQSPLPIRKALPAGGRQQAKTLLEAVTGHWTALKNTSSDGLREGFLQRAGKLTERPEGYLVEVERRAIDVLVERLPWGIAAFRLDWMGKMMWVNWG